VGNATPRPLYSQKNDPVPIIQEVRWAPGPAWMGVENLALTGILSADPIPSRYEVYASPIPVCNSWLIAFLQRSVV